jgi:DNA mismatch repair ATPase MutL
MVVDRDKEWVAVAAQPVATTNALLPMARGGGTVEVRELFGTAISRDLAFKTTRSLG